MDGRRRCLAALRLFLALPAVPGELRELLGLARSAEVSCRCVSAEVHCSLAVLPATEVLPHLPWLALVLVAIALLCIAVGRLSVPPTTATLALESSAATAPQTGSGATALNAGAETEPPRPRVRALAHLRVDGTRL